MTPFSTICLLHMLRVMRGPTLKYLNLTLTLFLLLSACRPRRSPIVVHVFRDPDGAVGHKIDAAIRTVGLRGPKTADGTPVVIATFEFKDYREGLATIAKTKRADLIIFDSRPDWAASIIPGPPVDFHCSPGITCVAVIPSWTKGKIREASEHILSAVIDFVQESR